MKEKLDKACKISEITDRHIPGSIWNEPKDWMMGMRKHERFLIAGWNAKSGATHLPGLDQVGLMVAATRSDRGYVLL